MFDDPKVVDASNLVATQLNSLVCWQAKVIITGKTEKKNKAKISLAILRGLPQYSVIF